MKQFLARVLALAVLLTSVLPGVALAVPQSEIDQYGMNNLPITPPTVSTEPDGWANFELFTTPYYLTVDLTNQIVTAYKKDADGDYSLIARQMICSTGLDDTPTPTGTYYMTRHRSDWHYFKKFKVWAQYATQIFDDYLFHSVLYSKKDVSTLNRTSVRKLGEQASHGCIRLTPEDAKWIYENCNEGTTCEIFFGEPNKELARELKSAVSL